ncbi:MULTISPECIES: YidB family protein [unclassified Streptomyces]|uniref:YidB family protein n=1 Tax=unclassified Streptomyces TaxID=2593676 RepID=UPI0036554EBE
MTADNAGAPDDLEVLLVHLADHGYADQVGSWMSPEVTNLPITGQDLLGALPEGALSDLAAELNLTVQGYADYLAQELPALVDGLSPQGELPENEGDEDALWAFALEDAGA